MIVNVDFKNLTLVISNILYIIKNPYSADRRTDYKIHKFKKVFKNFINCDWSIY